MKKNFLNILLLLLVFAQFTFAAENLSPRVANYDIKVSLDEVNKMLNASQKVTWKNISKNAVNTLQFHLYYNAFKNTESTFMQRSDFFESVVGSKDCNWGYSKILSVKDKYGNDLTDNIKFIHPEYDNENDETVIEITLPRAVKPNRSITIEMEWQAKIPKIMPRTGYNKDFYFFVQWFPKLGVYEPKGMRGRAKAGWNCHQYFSSGEYYADFGVYNVDIQVPKNYVVAASGKLQRKANSKTRTIWSYKVEDVIDFGWTASPHFVVLENKWKDVTINYVTYKNKSHCSDRIFQSAIDALTYMDEFIGEYPYETLTIVDPPIHGIFTGGMEYPTFISTISACFLPTGIKTPETLTTHEFVHQYFMQMVATHEQENPWMDEGFTTYFEAKILDKYNGKNKSTIDWLGIKVGNKAFNRWEHLAEDNPKIAEGIRKARDYKHGGYGTIAYNKTAMWLFTLEGLVGENVMNETMQTYFNRWKFKHPGPQDFIDVVNEIVPKYHKEKLGENMDWFFDQVLYKALECDFALADIQNNKLYQAAGFVNNTDTCEPMSNVPYDVFENKIIIHRLGEVKLPIDVKVTFSDGSEILEYWNGKERSKEFNYETKLQIVSAEIDPERKIDLDKNFINNSKTVKLQENGINFYSNKLLYYFQNLLQILSFFS